MTVAWTNNKSNHSVNIFRVKHDKLTIWRRNSPNLGGKSLIHHYNLKSLIGESSWMKKNGSLNSNFHSTYKTISSARCNHIHIWADALNLNKFFFLLSHACLCLVGVLIPFEPPVPTGKAHLKCYIFIPLVGKFFSWLSST